MTKLIIEIPEFGGVDYVLYRTKEEWDASYYSKAMHERNLEEIEKKRIQNGHMGRVGINTDVADNEPSKFPCLAIEGSIRHNANGYDTMTYLFIYDFEIVEDEPAVEQPELTQTLNIHGNNQCYLDGQAVCSQCRCAYTNTGPSPIGHGTMCASCRTADNIMSAVTNSM